MRHRATPRFWTCYNALPTEVRQLADRNYALLRQDPRHPSLHFKKIGQFWSVRVGLHYRALAIESGSDTEDEQFAEIEAAYATEGITMMAIPTELVPEVRALLARKHSA